MEYRGTEAQALQMLIDHERAISELYQVYSERIPDHREFWRLLAEEEVEHAEIIGSLLPFADKSPSILKKAGFKPAAVTTSMSFLRDLIQRARTEPSMLKAALSTAVDLEKAMIERKFFDIFDTPAPEAQKVHALLTDGTKSHVERIENEWQVHRSVS